MGKNSSKVNFLTMHVDNCFKVLLNIAERCTQRCNRDSILNLKLN